MISISIKIKTKHQLADCKICAFYDFKKDAIIKSYQPENLNQNPQAQKI